ncbi:carcinoembryonic antigen-related cell adhesion molecule 21-like [Colossoma macropomum]|uniref:carcinoembryonic antigen-related cell adhesion molecule 21-like n=1 Tax=Colossoma macropomum TaxID=42526 RepID=UPI0018649CB5|nr:carcinoembryonic antigen-related cell adhesion molecule 21-like [Colossoma macropomum]
MDFKDIVAVLFLCSLIIFTFKDCSACDYNAEEGDSLTIPLQFQSFDKNHYLRWVHNSMILYKRTKEKTYGRGNVTKDGSLLLYNVSSESKGEYRAEVYEMDGRQIMSQSVILCVYAKVPKPTVNVTCHNKVATFSCDVEDNTGLSFSWYLNENDMDQNEQTFSLKVEDVENYIQCAVNNQVDSKISDVVLVHCPDPAEWIGLAILVLVGALSVMMMIILVICVCQCCKLKKHLQYEENFSLHRLQTGYWSEASDSDSFSESVL